jgi:hypothetical protein
LKPVSTAEKSQFIGRENHQRKNDEGERGEKKGLQLGGGDDIIKGSLTR